MKNWLGIGKLFKKDKEEITEVRSWATSITDFIKNKKIYSGEINIRFNTEKPCIYYYCNNENEINIPDDFNTNELNFSLIKKMNFFFLNEEEAIISIISHELGHLIHHAYLISGHKVTPSRPYLIQSSNNNFTSFFNPKNNSAIDQFLHVNFAESYADCFSCLIPYLKDQSNCFNKVFKFREDSKNEEKKLLIEFKNMEKSGNLHIGLNNFAITEYFNYQAIKSFEDNFFKIFKDKISTFSYPKVIHQVIQNECIQELFNTTVNELNTNNLFLKTFSKFVENNGYSNIQSYLKEFESHISDFKKDTIKKIILEDDYFKNTDENKIMSDVINTIGNVQKILDIDSYVKYERYSNDLEKKQYIIEQLLDNKLFKNQFLQKFCSSETMSYIVNQNNRKYLSFDTNLKIKNNDDLREELLNQLKVPKEKQKEYTFNLLLVEVWNRNQQSLSFKNEQEPLVVKYEINIINIHKARCNIQTLSNTKTCC